LIEFHKNLSPKSKILNLTVVESLPNIGSAWGAQTGKFIQPIISEAAAFGKKL
jgi:hypothetical protein